MKHFFFTRNHSVLLQYILIALLLSLLVISGCGTMQFTSHWVSQPLDIAATSGDLQNSLTPIEDKPAMLGVVNDSNYLYLSIVTSDRSIQRQILFRGFTVWFDREGGSNDVFGIKFPLGMQMGDFRQMREEFGRDRGPDSAQFEPRLPMDTNEVEILGANESDHVRLKVIELKRIAVKIMVADGRMQYNLRVPLIDNGPDPYAIGTKAGEVIGVGLETASFEARPPQGGMEDDDGGGMPPGGGRGRRGGGGRFPRGGGQQQSQPLNFWVKVQLAGGGF